MMPLKCRGCKYYISEYIKIYHGVVEGCNCNTNLPYPVCYEKKEDNEKTN